MMLTTRSFAGFVLVASAGVLGAALASQFWGGLVPCELCLLQRWPWDAALVVALGAFVMGGRPALPWLALVLTAVFVTSVALAFYHVGVEQHWFAGPSACTTGASGAKTLEQMRAEIMGSPVVMCDNVQWSLFGVSLAGFNLLASAVMAAICGVVFARTRRRAAGVAVAA